MDNQLRNERNVKVPIILNNVTQLSEDFLNQVEREGGQVVLLNSNANICGQGDIGPQKISESWKMWGTPRDRWSEAQWQEIGSLECEDEAWTFKFCLESGQRFGVIGGHTRSGLRFCGGVGIFLSPNGVFLRKNS